jgi:hypothetical protein
LIPHASEWMSPAISFECNWVYPSIVSPKSTLQVPVLAVPHMPEFFEADVSCRDLKMVVLPTDLPTRLLTEKYKAEIVTHKRLECPLCLHQQAGSQLLWSSALMFH